MRVWRLRGAWSNVAEAHTRAARSTFAAEGPRAPAPLRCRPPRATFAAALLTGLTLVACARHASAPAGGRGSGTPATLTGGGAGALEGVGALGPGGGAIRYPAAAATLQDPLPDTITNRTLGREVYAQYCAVCHGVNLDGRGHGGGNLSPRPADLRAPHLRNAAPGQIFWIVTNGLSGSGMPPWDQVLSPEQRWAVTRFVEQNQLPAPASDPQWVATADPTLAPAVGRTLFQDDCAVCHGTDGRGMGPAGRALAPRPADLTAPYITAYSDAQLSEILVTGIPGTPMPSWLGLLSPQQRGQVVAYMRTLQSGRG